MTPIKQNNDHPNAIYLATLFMANLVYRATISNQKCRIQILEFPADKTELQCKPSWPYVHWQGIYHNLEGRA
jgi:hypothetical protein